MKVAIGARLIEGPWGGGNRFAQALMSSLTEAGHQVVQDLRDTDIDIILLTDPRWRSPNVSFAAGAILRYLAWRNPRAVVVHRINECDERKGGGKMNAALVTANYCADHTVFVGEWLRNLPVWRANLQTPYSTIRNGADTAVFNPRGFKPWDGKGPLRLVTHHWGYHWMKGFDIYEPVDRMLGDPAWRDRIEFTFVGNLPKGFRFQNARHVPPLDGIELADELRSHHAYLTASINEPGGNHQNEGALCGLPLLYRNSGCMPEYCAGFGVAFEPATFIAGLETMLRDYAHYVALMPAYPHTAARMCAEWRGLFEELANSASAITAQRRLWRSPARFVAAQLSL